MSSIAENKSELKDGLVNISDKIFEDYKSIPAELSRVCSVEGNVKGTVISICDTLAYLVGWGKLVVKWHLLKSNGKDVDFPETGFNWNQLGALATRFHEEYKDWNLADLIVEYERTINQIISIIDQTSDADLYGKTWYRKYSLGRMIQFNTVSPMKNMRTKIRRFKKVQGII